MRFVGAQSHYGPSRDLYPIKCQTLIDKSSSTMTQPYWVPTVNKL